MPAIGPRRTGAPAAAPEASTPKNVSSAEAQSPAPASGGWTQKGAEAQPSSPGGAGWAQKAKGARKLTGERPTLNPAALAPRASESPAADRMATALSAWNTDEKAVFDLLEKSSPAQVRELSGAYEKKTGHTLRSDLVSKLTYGEQLRAFKAYDVALRAPGDGTGTADVLAKMTELKRQGSVSEPELVNRYQSTSNNKIELYVQGKNAYPHVLESIKGAKDSVHVSYYIWENDELGNKMADELIAAKKRGVDVKVSLDGIGSQLMNPKAGSQQIVKRFEDAGIEVHKNHIVDLTRGDQKVNHPDHRKIVVVDGKVGFTGGMNVGDHYMDSYHDLMVRVEGDGVKQMQSEWMTQWIHMGGKFNESDADFKKRYFPELPPGSVGSQKMQVSQHIPGLNRGIMQTYLDQINGAKKSINIENPYCTNPEIQTALIAAAKRGVTVNVVLPAESDHGFSHLAAKQRYPEMIRAGVNIYEYPGFNHGKVMVTDEKFVTIGSSNLDDVALYHVYEMNMDVADESFAKQAIADIFAKDIPISKKMKAEDITQMQIWTGKFWNLFSHAI